MSAPQSSEQEVCCCRPYDPVENTAYRCIARALDLGHCRPGDCACRPLAHPTAPEENR